MPIVASKIAVLATVMGDEPRAAIKAARAAGFAGLLFDLELGGVNLIDLSATGRREFRHLVASQDIALVGISVELGSKGFGPGADIDRWLSKLDHVLESAAGLAAPLVCLDLGPLPEPPPRQKPRPKITPEQAGIILLPFGPNQETEPVPTPAAPADPSFVSQVDAALFELGRRADRYQTTIALRGDLASFAALECALNVAACPWFGIDLDPVAILRDPWTIDDVFSALGSVIRHVRARDALVGADKRTKPAVIGRGSTNWEQLLRMLDETEYKGWVTIDSIELNQRLAAVMAGAEHLRSV